MGDDIGNLIPVERLLQKRCDVARSEEPEAASRDILRSRRKRDVRGRVVSIRRMPKYDLEPGRAEAAQDEAEGVVLPHRPRTRGECAAIERPCPFVSCTHHLYLDVVADGAIRLNFPDLEPDEMPVDGSCSLDVADEGPTTLERVGEMMNLTRERVRQIEAMAYESLAKADRRNGGKLGQCADRGVERGVDTDSDDVHGASKFLFRALSIIAESLPKILPRRPEVGANGLRIGDVVPKEDK